MSITEAKELARHTDVKMTMKYAHSGIDDQHRAVQTLPRECSGSDLETSNSHSVASGDGEMTCPRMWYRASKLPGSLPNPA
jgi:hypothetical protein